MKGLETRRSLDGGLKSPDKQSSGFLGKITGLGRAAIFAIMLWTAEGCTDTDTKIVCNDGSYTNGEWCKEANCYDGIDNDRDGLIDCHDYDCNTALRCQNEMPCDDGLDNDENGETDCKDRFCIAHNTQCKIETCLNLCAQAELKQCTDFCELFNDLLTAYQLQAEIMWKKR